MTVDIIRQIALTGCRRTEMIRHNPAHGLRKPKDRVRDRRLTEASR